MRGQLYGLGPFRFRTQGPSADELSHLSAGRWQKIDRLQAESANQYIGRDNDEITLNAIIYTRETPGFGQVEAMRSDSALKTPHMLVSGYGRVFGLFVIVSVENVQTFLLADGSPQRVEFSLTIRSFGNDSTGGFGRLFG